MKGKTVLFTGSSRGMGRIAAIRLAELGAKVIVVGHDDTRGTDAVDAIQNTGGSAEFFHADMGDANDVSALAQKVLSNHNSIHVLIHSAGGLAAPEARTREAVDRGFAQNFLGGFLLTRLLEKRLLASAPARVIAVTSSVHKGVKKVEELNEFLHPDPNRSHMSSLQKGNYQMHSYRAAKFALTAWMYGLASNWAGRGVTANILDPRIVKSKLGENFEGPAVMGFLMGRLIPFFAAPGPDRGSKQYVRLAADPALADVSGMYFVSGKEKNEGSSTLARDPSAQKEVDDLAEAWARPFLSAFPTSLEAAPPNVQPVRY